MDCKELLTQPQGGQHLVQLYRDPGFLFQSVSLYVETALKQGRAAILITRDIHWESIRRKLKDKGFDIQRLEAQGQLTQLNAEKTMEQFLVNGRPDGRRFREVVGDTLKRISARYGTVCAYGEMVDVLWQTGRREAALILEELWNALTLTHSFYLLCGYGIDPLEDDVYGGSLHAICERHSHFIPAEDFAKWDASIAQAVQDMLQPQDAAMLKRLVQIVPPPAEMPDGAAQLLCLSKHLPSLGPKVIKRAREYYKIA